MACLVTSARATTYDDIGYTRLAAELGGDLPTGAGVGVAQIEALFNGNYGTLPSYYPSKTFTFKSGSTGYSSHANLVGRYFWYDLGVSGGVTDIDFWETNNWIGAGSLNYFGASSSSAPVVPSVVRKIQNHSWAALSYGTTTDDQKILRRFDYTIQRDNYLAVIGTGNSLGSVPNILASSYNGIVVGLSSGVCDTGLTDVDGVGRSKPDIVAPGTETSYATPLVSSAAALLLQKVNNTPALANASNSVALKALLLAGATKNLPDWARTTTQPLDPVYGVGQLNVYNSYHILTAGQQAASSASDVTASGWDLNTSPSSTSQTVKYFFEVSATSPVKNFSAVLTWNRKITASNWNNPSSSLANLDLKLYSASGYTLGALVDSSVGTVDNVEEVYDTLLPGRYALEVKSNTASTDFSLAWGGTSVLPGDVNMDGTVDLQDFGTLKDNFGNTGMIWTQGDLNGDSAVDLQDFGILKAYFGQSSALSSSLASVATTADGLTIPEPATAAMLLVGLSAILRRRRR